MKPAALLVLGAAAFGLGWLLFAKPSAAAAPPSPKPTPLPSVPSIPWPLPTPPAPGAPGPFPPEAWPVPPKPSASRPYENLPIGAVVRVQGWFGPDSNVYEIKIVAKNGGLLGSWGGGYMGVGTKPLLPLPESMRPQHWFPEEAILERLS